MQLAEFHEALEVGLTSARRSHPDARLTIWLTPQDWDMLVDASAPAGHQGRKVRLDGVEVGMLHGHTVHTSSLLPDGTVEIHAVVGTVEIGGV